MNNATRFNIPEKPTTSYFGRYPRSLQEAFRGVDYGCAISAPTPSKKWLVRALEAFPRVVWVAGIISIAAILVNLL